MKTAIEKTTYNFKDRAEALAKARALAPKIRQRAAQTEADRRVPKETIDELLDSGLCGIVTPKVFGGSELGFASLVEITAEIGAACGSTGWVFGVLTGHSWMLNLFPLPAQRDVLEDARALSATVYRLAGNVVREGDGYRLTGGEGRFCSGVDYAKWVIVGNEIKSDNAPPERGFFLLPIAEVEVIDDWFTAGMRGTGSRSIKIANAFIPSHRYVSFQDLQSGDTEGGLFHKDAIYRMPFMDLPPYSIIGAPLGMAKGALRSFIEGVRGKLARFSELQLAEQSAMLARVATAATEIDTAYELVIKSAETIDQASQAADITPELRARIPRDMAYAAQKCRYAVTSIFEINGGSGIYDSSELQRIWRDVNSAAQHFAFTLDSAMTNYGRFLMGVTPTQFGPKGR